GPYEGSMRFLPILLVACSSPAILPSPDAGPDAQEAGEVPDSSGPIVVDPGVISTSAASKSEHEPHIAAANGHVGIGWVSRGASSIFVGYRISIDDGQTWGPIGAL